MMVILPKTWPGRLLTGPDILKHLLDTRKCQKYTHYERCSKSASKAMQK